jgi:transcriptional regulator with XRE-family HTH domain
MENLRLLRSQKKLSLDAVADVVGVNASTLSRIERGIQHPNKETATKIANYYDISIGDVFDGIPFQKAS